MYIQSKCGGSNSFLWFKLDIRAQNCTANFFCLLAVVKQTLVQLP